MSGESLKHFEEVDKMIQKSEIGDGMKIDWDVPITMDDGVVLRADVFRPIADGRYPVIMSHGCYGKGLAVQEGYAGVWESQGRLNPEIAEGSTNKYQNWEVVDPEKWVPDGYVCIRVDSRGAGRSPGYMDLFSLQEAKDYSICIEWAAAQPWSNGKIGLSGISYYAMNQWMVAQFKPPHLAAMLVWEGAGDFYLDGARHGGILCELTQNWLPGQVTTVQHGAGERGARSRVTGELVAGPETLSDQDLRRNFLDLGEEIHRRVLDGSFWRDRSARWDQVEVPFLSCGNWGGQGLHLRGNIEGFVHAASKQKWLEVHGLEHWTHYYTPYGLALAKRFFGYFLKGRKTGWDRQPPLQLQIRRPRDLFVQRDEYEWPLARTQWTKYYLNPEGMSFGPTPSKAEVKIEYDGMGTGVTFLTVPFERETEITGPVAAKLFISSSTTDADLFLVLRLFDPSGEEVVFRGTADPHTPVAQGWLRASHRKLDSGKSLPYQPYHTHDELWPLKPGEIVELDIEIWPTCIVIPPGYRLGLTIRGKDYEWNEQESQGEGTALTVVLKGMRGCGPFTHADPRDRPPEIFGGKVSLHFGPARQPYVLLPIIPAW